MKLFFCAGGCCYISRSVSWLEALSCETWGKNTCVSEVWNSSVTEKRQITTNHQTSANLDIYIYIYPKWMLTHECPTNSVGWERCFQLPVLFMYTQMTLVLLGKGLVLRGWPSKIEVIGAVGLSFYFFWISIVWDGGTFLKSWRNFKSHQPPSWLFQKH